MNKIDELRNKMRESRITEILYLVSIFSYSFLMCYSSSEIITLPYLLRLVLYCISLLFAIPKVVSQHYTKKELILCLSMYFVTFVYVVVNKTIMYFIIPTILIGVKNSNTKTIAKILLVILLSFIIIHTISYTLFYVNNISSLSTLLHFDRSKYINNMHCYNHNRYGARWVCSYLAYLHITNRNDNRVIKSIILLMITVLIYALCQSRACMIIMFGICIFNIFENYSFFKFLTKIFKYVSLVLTIFYSIIIQYLNMDTVIAQFLNKLTTLRVEYAINNINLFGSHFIVQITNEMKEAAIDNLVQDYIIRYGYFLLIAITIILVYLLFINSNDLFIDYTMSLLLIMSISQRTPRHITLTLIPLIIFNNYFLKNDMKDKFIL